MNKLKYNLEGQRFGRWIVIRKANKPLYGNNISWECVCDCGIKRIVDGSNLRRGISKSCGCLSKELSSILGIKKAKDITGQKFGRLTAIKFIRREKKKKFWLFRCDCGVEKILNRNSIVPPSSQTKSCGCLNKEIKKKSFTGDNNPNWKGGITPFLIKIRGLIEYKKWRIDIYKKDNYTCQECGQRGGHNLEADHIKPFSLILKENEIKTIEQATSCKELWNIYNGRILCTKCHSNTPTYKGKMKLLLQI